MSKSKEENAINATEEPLHVLVVDDEPAHAEVVAASLERINAQCVVVHSAKEAKAKILQEGTSNIKVIFDEPQKAITPGQSAVFYVDDIVLGGGKIV